MDYILINKFDNLEHNSISNNNIDVLLRMSSFRFRCHTTRQTVKATSFKEITAFADSLPGGYDRESDRVLVYTAVEESDGYSQHSGLFISWTCGHYSPAFRNESYREFATLVFLSILRTKYAYVTRIFTAVNKCTRRCAILYMGYHSLHIVSFYTRVCAVSFSRVVHMCKDVQCFTSCLKLFSEVSLPKTKFLSVSNYRFMIPWNRHIDIIYGKHANLF